MPAVNTDDSSWRDTPIHVIDFEGSLRTGVVEYGVATLLGGVVLSARTKFCAPHSRIPPEETRIHGISDAQVAREELFSEESAFFMELRETGPICAHNAAFERHLLKSAWPYPRMSPDFVNRGKSVADWGPFIDTLRLYELVFPGLAQYGLGDIVETFGLRAELDEAAAKFCPKDRRKYHCALYDALGSALLLLHLGSLPGYENLSLDWLIVESQSPESNAGQTEMF
jgi:DNA polymerase III epsilon subunit-like protein